MGTVIQTINNTAVRDGKYLPTLDGWRAIAIILVLFAHGSDSIFRGYGLDLRQFHYIGLFGVQIFFGLSGFLITSRLIADEQKRGSISLSSFYIRRFFRILPASLVFLFTIAILGMAGIIPVTIGRWLSSLLFFANYSTAQATWYLGHFWSLAVEEHFYFVWPLVFFLVKKTEKRQAVVVLTALMIALWRALDFKLQITGSSPAVFWGRSDIQVDNIIWGVLVALLFNDKNWRVQIELFLRHPITMPLMIMTLVVLSAAHVADWKLKFILITFKAIIIPLLILGTMINANRFMFFILETPIFKLLGRLSYSIYLWQQLFLVWDGETLQVLALVQYFPINYVLVFFCAIVSFLLVEKPMIGFGHRIANRVTSMRAIS